MLKIFYLTVKEVSKENNFIMEAKNIKLNFFKRMCLSSQKENCKS